MAHDITRTIAIGTPAPSEKKRRTRVGFNGLIA